MVGQIGGLARVRSEEINKAADLALVWTGGWSKGDKAAIGKQIDELKAVLAANQAVYDQAAAALKELSAGQKALGEAKSKFEEDKREWQVHRLNEAERFADQEAALDAKRRATERALADRELAVSDREKAVSEREKTVEAANAEINKAAKKAHSLAVSAGEAQEAAQAVQLDYETKAAAIRKIIG